MMGLILALYKVDGHTTYKLLEGNNFNTYDEEEPIITFLKGFFGYNGNNEHFNTAIDLMRGVGEMSRLTFWIEQTLMQAKMNAEFGSSIITYDNPEFTDYLRNEGCKIITTKKGVTEVVADAIISSNTDFNKLLMKLISKKVTKE